MVQRWPAVPMEIVFNLGMLALALIWARRGVLKGQRFHVYLIAYGCFRFAHEFLRATPRVWLGWSGYQFAALAVAALGIWGFWKRACSMAPVAPAGLGAAERV